MRTKKQASRGKTAGGHMLVADYLRVAAKKAGVVAPPRTFGFHTFRRTLASGLVRMKIDIKTVQETRVTSYLRRRTWRVTIYQ